MPFLLQFQGPQLHSKSTSCNPANLVLANAEGFLQSGEVDKEDYFHAGCDRSRPVNANPARREIRDKAVTHEHLTGAHAGIEPRKEYRGAIAMPTIGVTRRFNGCGDRSAGLRTMIPSVRIDRCLNDAKCRSPIV